MLFDFRPKPVNVAFWMKDTYLPLDIVFIGPEGRVVSVKHDAKPMDETIIPSNAPTLGVLELDGRRRQGDRPEDRRQGRARDVR